MKRRRTQLGCWATENHAEKLNGIWFCTKMVNCYVSRNPYFVY
jgi:hypothetical protein